MSRASLSRRIRAEWPSIVERAGLSPALSALALVSLPKGPLRIAGSSVKVEKGSAARGIKAAVVYMAGALDWRRTCAFSTPACRAACLGHRSGRLSISTARGPQAWKLALYYGAPGMFRALLSMDMGKLARDAGDDYQPALRIDGASDTGASMEPTVRMVAASHGVMLWDYTKSAARALASIDTPGVDLTYSYAGGDWSEAEEVLRAGGRVAVVVDGITPETLRGVLEYGWRGWHAVDGDSSDMRFRDPSGSVVILSTKGDRANKARARASGFARPLEEAQA